MEEAADADVLAKIGGVGGLGETVALPAGSKAEAAKCRRWA